MPLTPLIEFEEEKTKLTWEAYQVSWANHQTKTTGHEPITIASPAIGNDMATQKDKTRIWNDIPGRGGTCDTLCQYTILISNWMGRGTPITAAWHQAISCLDGYPHNEDEIWQMANAKIEGTSPTLTREEQEQRLEEINTRLCDYCLILYDFQFCDNCDLIYNLPPHMIYTIPEEEEPINSCASESESSSNPDSNSNNDNNENNSSSSVQNGYDNDSNSDSNSDSNYEQYIALSDLTKEQELK
ncbi:hypothetical protein G9A89_017441 [Geosiphon pyriformis]|nr:hypothetical protein G9A89_017441 [Geosiphon pyriformis]